MKRLSCFICIVFFVLVSKTSFSQSERIKLIEDRLYVLQNDIPSLNQKIDFSVSGVTLQEFLRALAESNNLNVNVSPDLNFKVYNSFNQEKVLNILLFLIKEYDLEVNFVGTIMSFSKYSPPKDLIIKAREINMQYNQYSNSLSFDLKDDTLSLIVKKLSKISKKNIILSPNIQDKRVTLYINESNFDGAIEKLVYVCDLKIEKLKDNTYIISKRDETDDYLQNSMAGNPGKPRKSGKKGQGINYIEVIEDSLGKKWISIEVSNATIQDVLKSIANESGISYINYTEVKGSISFNFNRISIDDFFKQLLNGTEYTFYKNSSQIYLIGDRRYEGLRINKQIQLKNRSVDNVLESIPADLKKGVEAKEFKELNSFLFSGSAPQILEIEDFLSKIDVVVPMITIEVIMMDVRKGKSISTGIKAGLGDSIATGGTLFGGVDFTANSSSINDFLSYIGKNSTINIGKVSPAFYINLNALEQNSNIDIRSMPKLTTLNGHEANLVIGSTRYYSVTTQNVIGSLNPQTVVTQQFNPVSANLEIAIIPTVSGDEQVTLKIDVKISDFIGTPPNNAPPPSSNSQFKSLVRARNDEMIILGGIERTEKSETSSGFPILSRIPILKWIFSSRTKNNNKVVSVVFLKPKISY
jgi:type IV pilus assembly protein PilQ